MSGAPGGEAKALFVPEGGRYLPTIFAVGPWDAGALHGGPPAALLAGLIEAHETDPGAFHVARLTVEILRPVPLQPLAATVALRRPGKRVQIVDATLTAGDTELVRATAVRIRRAPVDVAGGLEEPPPPPMPEADTPPEPWGWPGFVTHGVRMRYQEGAFAERGPAMAWIALAHPVVAGTEVAPLQRAVAAADFGNGISNEVSFTDSLFINPDLTVYLHRPPAGEWVGLDARTQLNRDGSGLAQAALYDGSGGIGRSLQSLFVDRR